MPWRQLERQYRVGGRRRRSQDEELAGTAWAWSADVGSTHGCGVRVSLVPDRRRGVWVVRCQAVEVVEGRAVAVRAEVKAEWPDVHGTSLMGRVHALTCELDSVLTDDQLQRGTA